MTQPYNPLRRQVITPYTPPATPPSAQPVDNVYHYQGGAQVREERPDGSSQVHTFADQTQARAWLLSMALRQRRYATQLTPGRVTVLTADARDTHLELEVKGSGYTLFVASVRPGDDAPITDIVKLIGAIFTGYHPDRTFMLVHQDTTRFMAEMSAAG